MNGDRPSSLLPLNDALERLLEEARPKASPALWEDVSGGLHPISAAPDRIDAFGAAHDLTTHSLGLTGDEAGDAGHALIDDADGRFAIDRETGIVRLADPRYAQSEPGRVHEVRVRQPDGYEATFHLRIAEPLPEVVFSDGVDPFAAFAPAAAPAGLADLLLAPPPAAPMQAWGEIAAALGALKSRTVPSEFAPFGAALGENVRAFPADAPRPTLTLEDIVPSPAPRHARWLDS